MEKTAADNLIGNKLKELRESHNLKQADLAMAAGVKQSTYSQYETGKRTPSAIILYKIAGFYGLMVDDLLKLCIKLDNNIYYDAPELTSQGLEKSEFLSFSHLKRYSQLSLLELELLYNFSKLDAETQRDVIDYATFKRHKRTDSK